MNMLQRFETYFEGMVRPASNKNESTRKPKLGTSNHEIKSKYSMIVPKPPYCSPIRRIAMRLLLSFLILFCLVSFQLRAQSTFQPLDADVYHWATRAEIKTNALNGKFHSAVKPYLRKDLVALMDSNQNQNKGRLSKVDQFHIDYFREVNSEWANPDSSNVRPPVWNVFFRRKADILSHQDATFDVHANIVGYGSTGQASDNTSRTYINTRGIEVRGMVAKRVGFYTFMAENQMVAPGYVSQWVNQYNSLPSEGFWKRFGKTGYDFFSARGYITFNATKYIDFQMGHDRINVGNGHRSLILSDNGNSYSFARINTRVWKIQYTNLFANLKTDITVGPSGTPGSRLIPDKFLFLHRLGINIGKSVNIGLFESIIAGRDPAIYANATKVPLSYFNPIIFYRSIEQDAGSPDNACLGLDGKVNLFKRVQVYGQLFLDEFLLKEIKAQKGWWGNKYAMQAGFHYIDVAGIKNLDLQMEYNFVRPFTYTHQSGYTSYSHYSQPLAHSLGANFKEVLAVIRVQPWRFLNASFKAIYYTKGLDRTGLNYGGNVLLSYDQRAKEYGNSVGQGRIMDVLFLDATVSYQVFTNCFLDFKQVIRKMSGTKLNGDGNTSFSSVSIRWNVAQRPHDF